MRFEAYKYGSLCHQIRVLIFYCTFSNNKLVVWEANYGTFNLCIFNHMCGVKFKS